MSLFWHKNSLELVIFKKQQIQEELEIQVNSYPFVRDTYLYKGTLYL